MKLALIDNWTAAYKFASVHAALLIVAWGLTPAADQAAIMSWLGLTGGESYVPAILGFVVIYARLVKQQSVSGS